MAFSTLTKGRAWLRAGMRCECERKGCGHPGRCSAILWPGRWEAHHRTAVDAGGDDSLGNCEALCVHCHQRTGTYGRGSIR